MVGILQKAVGQNIWEITKSIAASAITRFSNRIETSDDDRRTHRIEFILNLRNDPHTCWTISVIVSYVHLKKLQVPLMGFKPMTSMVLVQCCNQLNYEATQLWTVQLVGLMCSWKRNDK